jgi:hypothetical protein
MTDQKPKPNTARPGGSQTIEPPRKPGKTQKPAPDEGAQQKEEVTGNGAE